MITQSDFEYAKAHPEAREEFVRRIDIGDREDLIADVSYRPHIGRLKKALAGGNNGPLMSTSKTHCGQSRIFVYDNAFDNYEYIQHADDFLSCLLDHERYHARQFERDENRPLQAMRMLHWELVKRVARPRNWNCDEMAALTSTINRCNVAVKASIEIPAYEHQLRRGTYVDRISEKFRSRMEESLLKYTKFEQILKCNAGLDLRDATNDPASFYTTVHKNIIAIDREIILSL